MMNRKEQQRKPREVTNVVLSREVMATLMTAQAINNSSKADSHPKPRAEVEREVEEEVKDNGTKTITEQNPMMSKFLSLSSQ